MPKGPKPILIDGSIGEGGGQLVRLAVALSAVLTRPVRITNIRANRPRGGGLKSQHVTALEYLASATRANVQGLKQGSTDLVFSPTAPPADLLSRNIKLAASSGSASTLLVFQAILPFLLFASGGESAQDDEAVFSTTLELSGGTNVSFSPSFEYVDQVLLPTLKDRFGVRVEGTLLNRGWSLGPQSRGNVVFEIWPLRRGEKLRLSTPTNDTTSAPAATHVDISIIAPAHMHADLQDHLATDVATKFPEADTEFITVEDSGHNARVYVILVARDPATNRRWARDLLTSLPKKGTTAKQFAAVVSQKVTRALGREFSGHGISTCDEFLQDQLVVFQALAEGQTSFPRDDAAAASYDESASAGSLDVENRMRKDRTAEPFGQGTLHSQTARWMASSLMPTVEWYNGGAICKGAGISSSRND